MSYLDSVAIDLRVHLPPAEIPVAVKAVERLAHDLGWELEFPGDDGLPWEHTLPIFEGIRGEG
jgi:hypothetical protein